MLEFVSASEVGGRRPRSEDQSKEESAREIRRKLKVEDAQLRKERREVREKRKLEDMAWKRMRSDRKEQMRQGLIESNADLFQALLARHRVITEKRKGKKVKTKSGIRSVWAFGSVYLVYPSSPPG